jgi:hypothetical protein
MTAPDHPVAGQLRHPPERDEIRLLQTVPKHAVVGVQDGQHAPSGQEIAGPVVRVAVARSPVPHRHDDDDGVARTRRSRDSLEKRRVIGGVTVRLRQGRAIASQDAQVRRVEAAAEESGEDQNGQDAATHVAGSLSDGASVASCGHDVGRTLATVVLEGVLAEQGSLNPVVSTPEGCLNYQTYYVNVTDCGPQ